MSTEKGVQSFRTDGRGRASLCMAGSLLNRILCRKKFSMRIRSLHGMLLVESVVASFLMLFAFMAATQLFDASLRWESISTNERLAAMVAERRLEDLRGWVAQQCKTTGFDSLNWSEQEVVDDSYPEFPGFLITVNTTDQIENTLARPETGRVHPPPGLHSPCSTLFTTALNPNDDQQKNQLWQSFPYTRDMTDSARLVQVTVTWAYGRYQYRLVSLLADSIEQAANPSVDFTTSPVVVSGPGSVSLGTSADYSVEVRLPSNSPIPDVTTLWTIRPTSAGSASIRPLDSSARSVRVTRQSSGAIVLVAKVRYRGKEIVGYSHVIN